MYDKPEHQIPLNLMEVASDCWNGIGSLAFNYELEAFAKVSEKWITKYYEQKY